MLTHLDLFSGIGGFALAAKWNGIETVQFVEIDQRCGDFLAKAWPGVAIHDDVRTFHYSGRPVFLLTGGVPCQPASRAGKQRGKEDDRWLWPEAVRVLGEVKPAWAIFENPPGIGDVGLAGILSDVESHGYEVRVFSIPACAVGSPQIRERYWIVGKSKQDRREQGQFTTTPTGYGDSLESDVGSLLADTGSGDSEQRRTIGHDETERGGTRPIWDNFVWLPCADGKVRRAVGNSQRMAHGLPVELLEALGEEGRQTPEECEVHRSILGALGNSIVPQVAAQIIAAIMEADNGQRMD